MERLGSTDAEADRAGAADEVSRRSLRHSDTFADPTSASNRSLTPHSSRSLHPQDGKMGVIMGASAEESDNVALMEDVPKEKQVGHFPLCCVGFAIVLDHFSGGHGNFML